MKRLASAVLLTLSTASTASAEATAVNSQEADVSCFVATLTLLESPDPNIRTAGQAGMMYWLGKLDGAAPNLDLENRVAEIAPTMTQEMIGRELMRCGQEIVVRGREVQEIGARLQERGL